MNEAERKPLVRVEHLKKYFTVKNKAKLHAVDDLSFEIYPGETLGLVGESGCGKSTVGNVLMRLTEPTEGKMYFEGKSVFDAGGKERLELCKEMQIIFQDPYSSLNPRKTVRSILMEAYKIHHMGSGEKLQKMVDELCSDAGITQDLLSKYPHELDGGKRQIVGIARALSLSPKFIVCDEPVSALDVSIQATIINLLMDLQKKRGLSFLFISHDLSVVRHISSRIAVMYLGEMIELAPTDEIFANAMHPYAIALLSAVPRVQTQRRAKRIVLKGDVPSPIDPGPGCRFAPRCWMSQKICFQQAPEYREITPGHYVACHFCQESRKKAEALQQTEQAETKEEIK